MTNITFRQLRFVDALARFRHFGLAAEACSVTQPALSMQIKALEESLGAKLFERGARQVRLTASLTWWWRMPHMVATGIRPLW